METKIKAIRVALENEMRERDFYRAQSEKTDNPLGKKMFARIAADEEAHYRRLEKIHLELAERGKWPELVAGSIGSTDIRATFRQLARQTQALPAASRDDLAALKVAIDFEMKGHDFYARLGAEAGPGMEKTFFDMMAAMEREHLLTLQDSLLFFENPDDWYAEHEKPQLEG
jgi:rubrerythrin